MTSAFCWSDQRDKIVSALVKALKGVGPAPKSGVNNHLHSSYMTLGDVLGTANAALQANGLVVLQTTEAGDDAGVTVATMLLHDSGQWVEGRVRVPMPGGTPHAAGSAITYGRRYGLAALVGLIADEDDDGNAAQQAVSARSAPAPRKAPAKAPPPNGDPSCPKCGGDMWDNRPKKASGEYSPKSPDFKCRDKGCGEVIWPDDDGKKPQRIPAAVRAFDEVPAALDDPGPDDLPWGQ